VRKAAALLKEHDFNSVMIVTDYYHMTRTKLAFIHEGVTSLQKAHIGVLQQSDAEAIGRDVLALFGYVTQVYVLPELEKIKKEAVVGADKAKADVEGAKKKVDKSLDTMPK